MQEVRPPGGPGLGPEAAPERPWSVKLATRTELLRASTVAEAQVVRLVHSTGTWMEKQVAGASRRLMSCMHAAFCYICAVCTRLEPHYMCFCNVLFFCDAQPGMMPPRSLGAFAPLNGSFRGLPLLQQPFAAVAAAMRAGGYGGGSGNPGPMPGTMNPVGSDLLELQAAIEARTAAEQGLGTGSPGPGGSSGGGPSNVDAAAAAAAAGPLPPGWRSMLHPATGALVYVNEKTGEQSWLDPRCACRNPSILAICGRSHSLSPVPA